MIYSLGMFTFTIGTLLPDELIRRTDWRHASNPRIGARDGVQFIGPGEQTISLNGSVYAEIADGPVSLERLHQMADQGDCWPLVNGAGRVFGAFIITTIDERYQRLGRDGTPRRIDFGIDLRRVDPAALGKAAR